MFATLGSRNGGKGGRTGVEVLSTLVKKRKCAALITNRDRSNGPAEHRFHGSMFFWSNWKMIPLK